MVAGAVQTVRNEEVVGSSPIGSISLTSAEPRAWGYLSARQGGTRGRRLCGTYRNDALRSCLWVAAMHRQGARIQKAQGLRTGDRHTALAWRHPSRRLPWSVQDQGKATLRPIVGARLQPPRVQDRARFDVWHAGALGIPSTSTGSRTARDCRHRQTDRSARRTSAEATDSERRNVMMAALCFPFSGSTRGRSPRDLYHVRVTSSLRDTNAAPARS